MNNNTSVDVDVEVMAFCFCFLWIDVLCCVVLCVLYIVCLGSDCCLEENFGDEK